jgi:ribosomal protein S18 acetylase RimI-like enzyme
MRPLEIRPFSDEDVEAAGALLAARHRAHRAAEPLLPPRYEEPAAATELVAELAGRDGASGSVALRAGRVVGYLLGVRESDDRFGRAIWVDHAGHAVEAAEDLRDLYAAAAHEWVEDEFDRHHARVPATDPTVLDAWYRLSFGQQHAYAIQEIPETPWPDGARPATEADIDALVELAPLLSDHQARSPVFVPRPSPSDRDELRRDLVEDFATDEVANLVFERDGRAVGWFHVTPVERSGAHAGVARPEGAALLSWAATDPAVRGSGAGLALTHAAFAWARDRGHETMVIDWRVTNLLASRFWPARGFRETFLRLYRHIP